MLTRLNDGAYCTKAQEKMLNMENVGPHLHHKSRNAAFTLLSSDSMFYQLTASCRSQTCCIGVQRNHRYNF